MRSIIFFAFSFSISLCHTNFEKDVLSAHKEKIERKKREHLWGQCAVIQELGLSPITPCSADRKSEQLIWLVEQKEKGFSANILN